MNGWIAVLSGLIGAVAALALSSLKDWIVKPRLRITANAEIGGCVVETPAVRSDGTKVEQRYLRLRVDNDGYQTAKGVCVSISRITRRVPNAGNATFDEEVMDLTWPFGHATHVDIPPRTHRFVNLCHTTKATNGDLHFEFDVSITPFRIANVYDRAGTTEVELLASAENVSGRTPPRVRVDYDGTFHGVKFV